MLFNTLEFAFFFVAFFATYFLAPQQTKCAVILIASYVFYAAWDPRFLILIFSSTVVDYRAGIGIADTTNERARKVWLSTSIAFNLSCLGFFKYWDFFAEEACDWLNSIASCSSTASLDIILPVGISFYTFQSISYTYDVYRNEAEPTRKFVTFATFIAFFPQLVAGPIERTRNLMPQLENLPESISASRLLSGSTLFLVGLTKKVVIADQAAIVADATFGTPDRYSTADLAIGVIAFSIQIYGDFSGYTDMARGLARAIGVDLSRNFDRPYLAPNISEFWRRWHMSLSGWLRDYLYRPLGGNRSGRMKTYRNLLATMTLGGLWHGAGRGFILWGVIHGVLLCAHRLAAGQAGEQRQRRSVLPPTLHNLPGASQTLKVAATFLCVAVAWIPFRAPTSAVLVAYLSGLAAWDFSTVGIGALLTTLSVGAAILGLDLLRPNHERITDWLLAHPSIAGGVTGAALVLVALQSAGAARPFIYFQF